MKDDLHEAALRLSIALPVHTHLRAERHRSGPQNRGYIKRAPDKRGPAGIPRPIRVGRRTFESITKAKVALGVSPKTLYGWLDTGKARYV